MSLKLYGILYSPWTERARWALHHHHIEHRYREHVPYLGEPILRWLYRGIEGQPSVPLLKGPGVGVGDSWGITVWADDHGSGEPLRTGDAEVIEWFERLDPVVDLVRVRVTRRTLGDAAALTEAATAAAPQFVAPALKPVAVRGAKYIARKYGFEWAGDPEDSRDEIELMLREISNALDTRYLVGGAFSAADLVAATLLHGVEPLHDYPGLGPETRRMWRDERLADKFPELLDWRDEMYAKHWPGGRLNTR